MKPIDYETNIEGVPGLRADAIWGDTVVEVLVEPRDARRLRTKIMDMARIASVTKSRVVLLLDEPALTEPRLQAEWEGAVEVLRPELLRQLSVAIHRSGEWQGIPVPPNGSELPALETIREHMLSRQPARSSRISGAYYEILRILIHQWLLGKGPVTIKWLMETSGTSHPTVSKAIARLGHSLIRHSDRSVELRYFPRDEWAHLLAVSDEVRSPIRFADQSGQARSPESLLRRLRQLQRDDIAVGGVWGATHYQSSLDLVGNPRLDLSIHSGRKAADVSFVRSLDPALDQTKERDQSPILIVHAIHRAASLFQPSESGVPWADPVECLLDLHEARLESQAHEFLNSFAAAKGIRDEP